MPKKNSRHLTDPGIGKMSKAKKGKRIEKFDAGAPGLCLRITDNGVKSWSVYYRLGSAHKRETIGRWPEIGVAQARNQARDIKDQAKAGIDPKGAREALEAAAEDETPGTFGAIAELYIKRECLGRDLANGKALPPKLKRGWEVERIIRRELMPHWQHRPLAELRKRDAIKLPENSGHDFPNQIRPSSFSVPRWLPAWRAMQARPTRKSRALGMGCVALSKSICEMRAG